MRGNDITVEIEFELVCWLVGIYSNSRKLKII